MSAEGLPKNKGVPKSIEASSEMPIETSSLEQNPVKDLTKAELKEKLRAVIVNMDQLADQAARDAAERSLTASAESMKGVPGFFKRIWTQTLAREYYRQKHVSQARETIHESQNIHAAELEHPTGKEEHEATVQTIVERFTQDYEETLHKGETRGVINREGADGLNIKGEIISLMKDYATGKIGDDDFNEAKKQILHTVNRVEGSDKNDSMYADNLLEIARQVKSAVNQKEALEALDSDLEIVLGSARDSIQTEAKYNVVDKAIEFAKKTPLGVLVNESTLASGIAIAAGVMTGVSKRLASSRLAAWGTFGATAALTGGIIGYAENKRTKEDRAQHQRETAQGRTYERDKSPRREEMEKFTHEMREASQLSSAIREATSPEAKLSAIADAEARIRLMDRENIDLLSYSDPVKVEQERLDLDLARAQAKAELRKMPTTGGNFDEELKKLVDIRMQGLTQGEGGIEERDRLFNKMKNKRVASAAAKGVLIGLTVGTAAQEATAFFNDDQTGLVEHLVKGGNGGGVSNDPVVHTTWMEGLRRFAMGEDGGPGTPAVTEHINTTATASEYLEHHKLGTHISRDGWYDNDTPKPVFDKNELKLWWGGEKNTGIDASGNYVFSARHMVPEGSYHGGLSANAQELMKEGKLKMLLSLSQGTQAHPIELPINADGTVTIDPKSEIGKLFFAEKGGKATFLGRFAEVAQLTGAKDGTDHVRILATHIGKGVDELTDVITKEIPPVAPSYFLIDPPPFIPIYGRTPLEPVNGKKGPNPFIPFYYGSGAPLTPEEIRAHQKELSPRLRANPDAKLEARVEEEEYMKKQTPEYLTEVERLAAQSEPMNPACKVAICIPVAGHQEVNNIERTLSSYLNQTIDKDTFELVLFVNQPDLSPRGEKIKSDGTLDRIEKFKKEHPELNIRVMQSVIPIRDARIGNVRKMLSDATLARSLKREGNDDLIMVSNDADLKGVSPEYVKNFVEKFEKEPQTDAFMGQLDWDPEAYIRNPLNHIGTRLFQYISAQHRKANKGIESSGANFAYRASTYAAIGGYNTKAEMGEDNDFGRRILSARRGASNRKAIAYGGARVSRLYTSSRRAEKAIRDGLAPIEQWEKGFSAFDDEVRKVKWEETGEAPDYDNPEVVKKLTSELENIINRTLMVSSKWWSNPQYAAYQRRALGWLGIKYKLTAQNRIQITDATDLIAGLKEYKEEGLKIMERKTGKRPPEEKAPPEPKPPEPAPAGEPAVVAAEEVRPAAEEKILDAQMKEKSAIEKIILPDDLERTNRLRSKLEEYKERLKGMRHLAPEELTDTVYKIDVLEPLLDKREIDVSNLEEEFRSKYGDSFDSPAFINAVAVIDDYSKNEGRNVKGGTGLKKVAPVVEKEAEMRKTAPTEKKVKPRIKLKLPKEEAKKITPKVIKPRIKLKNKKIEARATIEPKRVRA
ncbi:hypothetical protein D4R49_02360 [bacterium]|nr:MAG: hypothetical protein D4R49_02360 [bacterium]